MGDDIIYGLYVCPAHGPEIFKPVTYPTVKRGNYEVSNYGRVYSNKWNILMTFKEDKDGYYRLNLKTYTSSTTVGVHDLVAYEFCDGYDPMIGRIIPNHLDGDVKNNFFENLKWSTQKENINHAYITGLHKGVRGEKSNLSKYTDAQILQACELKQQGLTNHEISDVTGIKYSYVHELFIGKKRIDITSQFTFPEPRKKIFKGFPKETNIKILRLLGTGYKPKEICELLNIEYNYTHKVAITNLRKKLK